MWIYLEYEDDKIIMLMCNSEYCWKFSLVYDKQFSLHKGENEKYKNNKKLFTVMMTSMRTVNVEYGLGCLKTTK